MQTRKNLASITRNLLGLISILWSLTAWAVPPVTGEVFDDFNDGDTSDWSFFGGTNAGGGGGPANDRPKEGPFYFSTGWGGDGTASGFYGGAFRNLSDASQLVLPADPWFNVWVLNQSDATVDSYDLEITIREDLDGNGWTNGSEDSIRLVTTFDSSSFNDEWILISAPLGSFTNLGTGGNGSFDGKLDELVLVIAGVQGSVGSVVEVDFDQFIFTSSGPAAFDSVVFDDMEHGNPLGNGWFSFNGSVGGGAISPNSTDLPPGDGGVFSLASGWGSGGIPGFYGGFGRTNPTDLSGTQYFNFWIKPDAGQDYTLEINLQEDDDGDGAANSTDNDDEFQFNCVISPSGPCAISGGGWQQVSIPLSDFFDDNSFFTGGNGTLDPTPASRGGNGELINVVMAVIGSGSDVTLLTDYWTFTLDQPAHGESSSPVEDFENGIAPATPCGVSLPLGFCTFAGGGSVIALSNPATPPAPANPATGIPNSVLQLDIDSTSFAGFIHGFTNSTFDAWIPQDWSNGVGISFWMYGSNSGTQMFLDILDNRNPGSTTDDAERWTVTFSDDFSGWQQFKFPFTTFVRKEIGNGALNDGFGLLQIHGYSIGTLSTQGPWTSYVDEVRVYGATDQALGTVIVEKRTLPAGSLDSFEFTESVSGTIVDGGQLTLANQLPGTYTSTELPADGWILDSIVCDDDESDTSSSGDVNTGTATFKLDAGETVTCVFTNIDTSRILFPKAVPTMSTYVLIFTILGLIAVASGGHFRRKFRDG